MKLTIRTKLLIGFGTILAVLIVLAVFLTQKLSESNERLDKLINISTKKLSLSQELLISVLDAGRQEKNLLLEKEPDKRNKYREKINTAIDAVNTKSDKLSELMNDSGAVLLDQFTTSWKKYQSTLKDIIALSDKGNNDSAFVLSSTVGFTVREEASSIVNRIVLINQQSMDHDKAENEKSYNTAIYLIITMLIAGLLLCAGVAFWIIRGIAQRISFISGEAEKIASREELSREMKDKTTDEMSSIFNSLVNVNRSFSEVMQSAGRVAQGDFNDTFVPRSEKDILGNSLVKMTTALRETTEENEKHAWLTNGQNLLNENLRGDQSMEELSTRALTFLCNYIHAGVGAFYTLNEKDNHFHLTGKFAFSTPADAAKFQPGAGLIGQAAAQQKPIYIDELRDDHVQIISSVTRTKPDSLMIAPFVFEGTTLGVVEVGKLGAFTQQEKEFFLSAMESIGISINSAIARKRIQQLLEETQVQSEELQSQQEELRQVNEELEEQAQNLKQQQEELQITNEELEEQTQALEVRNREVEAAKVEVEQKTKQLEITGKYKSEFLANMSHELRTPLNSLLILSKDLAENKKKNLLPDQVEGAEIIYKSGTDLLVLINEVLDLSKIEAGKMTLNPERIQLSSFAEDLRKNFHFQASNKGLLFSVRLSKDLPESITSDAMRLNQVLKNLLSNAIKFTDKGEVSVEVNNHSPGEISISVKDTGIGIPADKQQLIFEAFHQADGGTSRKYGGTGLGLSISRELVRILGGEIRIQSKPGEGSTFTIILPREPMLISTENRKSTEITDHKPQPANVPASAFSNYPTIADDRNTIQPGDRTLLIIEDDLRFAEIIRSLANAKNFKCIAAATGEDGLILTEKYKPNAIILDIDLPGIDGHRVLNILKSNPALRHIPVHIISVNERSLDPIREGAVEYLMKPVSKKQLDDAFNRIESLVERKMKNLLIIEDDDNSRKAIRKLIGNGDVKCLEAATGNEGISICSAHHIDCIVLDLGLPDLSGFDLIRKLHELKQGNMPPVIIYTGKELTKEENDELQKYTGTIIIKGVKSEERLLDETALFLHRTISNLPESKQRMIATLYDKETVFRKKKILIVDDDMRNIFALSKVLKERGMEIHKAENGRIALEMLSGMKGFDLVLMDIMMPEMDGYEAMRRIRADVQLRHLPVIALTAKAMKEDKQKCIDAGASEYISKPVDVERLLSLMRVWLNK